MAGDGDHADARAGPLGAVPRDPPHQVDDGPDGGTITDEAAAHKERHFLPPLSIQVKELFFCNNNYLDPLKP